MGLSSSAAFAFCFSTLVVLIQAQDFVIDDAFVSRAITAAELSGTAQSSNPSSDGSYDIFQEFSDGSERAVIAKKDGTCFAAFSSELPNHFESVWDRIGSLFDRISSLFRFDRDIFDLDNFTEACSNDVDNRCCDLRSPVNRSFQQTSFRNDMETALRDCVATCPDCPVVLTGHHQGGAVANAAGVYLADLNPVGITFGAPTVFLTGGCDAIDSENWYRFVNSVESQYRKPYGSPPGGLVYDMLPLSYDNVPLKPFPLCDHVGQYLILSQNTNVAYIGMDSQQEFRPLFDDAGRLTVNDADRFTAGYLDRLTFIRNEYTTTKTYPVPLGYAKADLCTKDIECASGNCLKLCPLCPPRCGS